MNYAKLLLVCFFVHHNYAASLRSSSNLHNSKCMEHYRKNLSTFDVCKQHPCLLFKEDEPYVSVRSKTFVRYPFKCRDSLTKYKNHLGGSFFEFIRRENIPALEDAYCIFNGDECSFDNEIDFLSYAVTMNRSHQFMVTGLMFIMSYRINTNSIPTTTFTHGPILIIGPPESRDLSFTEALKAVLGPFEMKAWVLIIIILLFFMLVRIAISYSFTTPFNWAALWWNVLGEYKETENHSYVEMEPNLHNTESNNDDFILSSRFDHDFNFQRLEREKSRDKLKFNNKYWSKSSALFVFLTLLFYELALVNHLFELLDRPPRKSIEDLSSSEMKRFVLLKDSGIERYFKLTADPRGEYANSDEVPWMQVSTLDEVYESIIKNRTFSLSYDWSLILEMKRNRTCDKLTFYETENERSYNGGWFYSKDVPENTRIAIDKSLSELLEVGKANKVLHNDDRSAYKTCGRSKPKIGYRLLFLLMPIPLVIMISIFLRVLYSQFMIALRRRQRTA